MPSTAAVTRDLERTFRRARPRRHGFLLTTTHPDTVDVLWTRLDGREPEDRHLERLRREHALRAVTHELSPRWHCTTHGHHHRDGGLALVRVHAAR